MLHTFGVVARAEDGDLVIVGSAKGFEAFVALLAVVKSGRHAMQAEKGVFDKGRCGPLAGAFAIVRFDMTINCKGSGRASA